KLRSGFTHFIDDSAPQLKEPLVEMLPEWIATKKEITKYRHLFLRSRRYQPEGRRSCESK
ncbi:MAG: hypothetical protein JWM11_6180, partial [Planctomycetaceae bacterium]|nr:hypothetical protein [Planctomycetaceae bacterium]